MSQTDKSASSREIINWLRGATCSEITAVAVLVNRQSDTQISIYGTKEQLLAELRKVPREDLWQAVDSVFFDGESEEDEDDEDDLEEDDDEGDLDEDSDFDEDESPRKRRSRRS